MFLLGFFNLQNQCDKILIDQNILFYTVRILLMNRKRSQKRARITKAGRVEHSKEVVGDVVKHSSNVSQHRDPVCLIPVHSLEHAYVYNGIIYYFCTNSCRDKFAYSPELYVTK